MRPNGHKRSSACRAETLGALALGLVYLSTVGGHLQSIDGRIMFEQARALLWQHSLVFPEPLFWRTAIETSPYGLGLSLLYIPGLLATFWMRAWAEVPRAVPLMYPDPIYTAAGVPVHVLIATLSAWLVARTLRELGAGRSCALCALALFGLASPSFVYVGSDFAQPLAGLFWIAAFYLLARPERRGERRTLLCCAALLFGGVLTRPVDGSLLAAGLAVALVPLRGTPRRATEWFRRVHLVGWGMVAGVLATLLVNLGRYGSALTTGYAGGFGSIGGSGAQFLLSGDIARGLPGLLVSPGRGLLWAFPAVALAPLGWLQLFRGESRAVALAIGAMVAALLGISSAWVMWWGGCCWGPRLLLSALPLLAVLAGLGLGQLPASVRTGVGCALLVAGLAWSLPGVLVDPVFTYCREYGRPEEAFRIGAYPLFSDWATGLHPFPNFADDRGAIDIYWLRIARHTGLWSLAAPGVMLIAALFLAHRARTRGR